MDLRDKNLQSKQLNMSYQGCSSMIQYKLVTHHEPEYIKKNEVFYKEFAEKVFNRKPHFLSSDISVR